MLHIKTGDDMNIHEEITTYDVSRETMRRLEEFVALLQVWNNKMNLVSRNSLSEVWLRHILDSVQLIKYINQDTRNLVDIGSGAGFPGIVIAILGKEKMPAMKINLVESIAKKTMYLKDICVNLDLDNVEIFNKRVEDTVFKGVDVITARAVSSLDKLLEYSYIIAGKETKMIFPKGITYDAELTEARRNWNFDCVTHKNMYHEDGVVLEISKLGKKK